MVISYVLGSWLHLYNILTDSSSLKVVPYREVRLSKQNSATLVIREHLYGYHHVLIISCSGINMAGFFFAEFLCLSTNLPSSRPSALI